MSFKNLLSHKVWILTQTISSNALGEINMDAGWNTSSSAMGRMSPISDYLSVQSKGEYEGVRYKLFLLPDTAINYDNEILYDDNRYIIKSIKKDSLNHHLECLLTMKS